MITIHRNTLTNHSTKEMNMLIAQWKEAALALSATLLLTGLSGAALAEEHHHSHDHAAQVQLTLDNGKKWATDANLRQAMGRIRDALAAELPAIHSGKATTKQYRKLSRTTHDQVTFMVDHCKLDQKGDAVLHLLLADLIAGADAMAGQDVKAARNGAEKISKALDDYGTYFDHPGWHIEQHTH